MSRHSESKRRIQDSLAHKLIHMYGHCKFNFDRYDLRHYACSEVRAWSRKKKRVLFGTGPLSGSDPWRTRARFFPFSWRGMRVAKRYTVRTGESQVSRRSCGGKCSE
ncbi:hypothetical protein BKA82DRAFT_511780 [Pisolithus tinctorius]|uniref:Mitochondrial inner membrane protease ATP23 n=1 Tax=Pisolithus tinctorius Marx 270 TaxID=870435 RepID=A0A0C3NXE5_PISTI|nr:hypothetical protein BKA82DRAFT_511780 [Pisolithus tinctorius]KIO05515.1 hypothetical protein M404DRAFT_511780 [Pisolithus tinctorius Marx 270]